MKQCEMFNDALWLGAESSDNEKFFVLRGSFTVRGVKTAKLRVLGLGFFHCYINGVRVSDDLFLPLNTDFEARTNFPPNEIISGHRIYVPEYDITSLVKDGENIIAIHFGGGWYTYDAEQKFGDAKAIWRVFGEGSEGKFDFTSSTHDKIRASFVEEYNLTTREMHNYLAESADAVFADFDDTLWERACPARPLNTEYLFTDCPADRVCDIIDATKLGEKEDYTLYDCGKNISGYPVLRLCGKSGDTVRVSFSEELMPDGTLSPKFSHKQELIFVCDGNERIVRPLFTWFGFRYFTVSGQAQVQAVEMVHTAVEITSFFASDNALLNWIHDTYINTQLTNMHAGIPSDCPHIERRGYTGDGQLVCHAAMNIFDTESFYRKWIEDIADCQDKLTGHIQYTAPYTHSGGGPGGWGCAIVEVPYQFYLHYGDTDVLRDCYGSMLRYFDYLEEHSYGKLVVSDKEGEWCLGDWCPPALVTLPPPFVNNYFYIKSLYRCIEIAKIIDQQEDIPMLEERIAERKAAITAVYFDKSKGNFFGGVQGANAFAVDIGLGDERTYPNLVKYYEEIGYYDTGIFGTDVLTRVLFERGDGKLASKLLLSKATHSFDAMRRSGATTIWEYWPASLNDRSHNHPMFGAVVAYLYDYLLGIRASNGSAGYADIEIAPVIIDEVNQLSGHRTLPSGRVSVSYEKSEGQVSFNVIIPEGQQARFVWEGKPYTLHSGENRFEFELFRNIIIE